MYAKFQQKLLNSMVIVACKSFQFFRTTKVPGFLKTILLLILYFTSVKNYKVKPTKNEA